MTTKAECPWRKWVHAALVHDLSVHLVGVPDAVARAEKVAEDLGNLGFLWSTQHYMPRAPAEAAAAIQHAKENLFHDDEFQTLIAYTKGRPVLDKRAKRTLYTQTQTTPLLQNVDAPAALATWNLLHPGATTLEIQRDLLVGDVQDAPQIFAADHPWVANRVKTLMRAARGLAVRNSSNRSKSARSKTTPV